MSDERKLSTVLAAEFVLLPSLYLCLYIASPINKFIVFGVTLILWSNMILVSCLSFKQAAQGRPLLEFKKSFSPNQSRLFVIFFAVVCGSFSLLSLMGFFVGVMAPIIDKTPYTLEAAKFISVMAILGFVSVNAIASYFGFRRYHKRGQPRG